MPDSTPAALIALGKLELCHNEATRIRREPAGWRDEVSHHMAALQAFVQARYFAYLDRQPARARAAWDAQIALLHIHNGHLEVVERGWLREGWPGEMASYRGVVDRFLEDCLREDRQAERVAETGLATAAIPFPAQVVGRGRR